jgi:integrase
MTKLIEVKKSNDQERIAAGRALYYICTRANGIKKLGDKKGGRQFFATHAEAAATVKALTTEEGVGGVVSAHEGGTVGRLIDEYVESTNTRCEDGKITEGHRVNLTDGARCWLDLHVNGVPFKQIKCMDVTTAMVELKLLPQFTVSAKTIKEKMNPLKQAFDLAHKLAWCSHVNPIRQVKLEEIKYKGEAAAEAAELERFSIPEIRSLIVAANEYAGADGLAVAFACQTGLRFGEQAALKWKHLDFDRRVVRVRVALRKGSCGTICADIPKMTKQRKRSKSVRNVFLTEDIMARLKEWRLKSKFSGDEDFVFCTSLGTPQRTADNWRKRVLHTCCKAVGMHQLRWHDLRHFFASISLELYGNDLVYVADLLGHESVETTRQNYAHWIDDPDRDSRSADKLNQALWG